MQYTIPAGLRPYLGRLRRRLVGASDAVDPDRGGGWSGPSVADAPALTAREVADLVLLQGVRPPASAAADSAIELDIADVNPMPIDNWFPHPDDASGGAVAFSATLDAEALAHATRARVRIVDTVSDWVALPDVRTPRGMPGTEVLDTCPACGVDESTEFGRRQGLTMRRCAGCGLVMTSPRPAEDKTLVRYSEDYFATEYLATQTDSPELRAHIDALLDVVEPHRDHGTTLYEIGVGGGSFLRRARQRGWNVRGSDVNPAAVEHVRAEGLDAELVNVDHASSLGGPYTAVVSEMSLEHVRSPDHVVAVAADALAPGGALLVYTVSSEGQSIRREGMASYLVGPAEHLFLFSAASLVSLCQRSGLRVDRLWRGPTGDDIGILAVKDR